MADYSGADGNHCNIKCFVYYIRDKEAHMGRRVSQDGCARCIHYIGAEPVNIFNFKCERGEDGLKCIFCPKFERRREETNESSG